MENKSHKNRVCLVQKYAELRSLFISDVTYDSHFSFIENCSTYEGSIRIGFNFEMNKVK